MVVPTIPVPYDSIPMLFLIPDKNGRKKALKDLNAHLESFRSLCAKIADLSAERASVDKFVEDLDAIDKNLSPVQYDNALLGFLHSYGNGVSVDVQAFVGSSHSNLDKCQFLTQEFQKTNVLVPDQTAPAAASTQAVVPAGGGRQVSAYVSIFFDVATIISNLWPGHQFQYLPALARNFHDASADLYYTDWIHTTGDTLGALMCCPGKWEEQTAPTFDLVVPVGESLLRKQTLVQVRPKDRDRRPFSLYGHDWKLLVTGPKGESLPPVPLAISPAKDAFVAAPAPLLEPLQKLGSAKIKARIVGRWGFTSIATDPLEVTAGCDPAWTPLPDESRSFQVGRECRFKLPATWAANVESVSFHPAKAGAAALVAQLKVGEGGEKFAIFEPRAEDAGAGTLELFAYGAEKPALSRPMVLLGPMPEVKAVEIRAGEASAVLKGHNLKGVQALELAKHRYLSADPDTGDGDSLLLEAVGGKPPEGKVGDAFPATLLLRDGGKTALDPVVLLPARPRLGGTMVIPVEGKGTGLRVTSTLPVAPTGAPSQVSLFAAKGYRFPSDSAFHAAVRNAEEPSEVRTVPSAKIRVMGNNQKATFSLNPIDLLGGRASGRLEVQVQDDHCGNSDWVPLPATFLDLPVIVSVLAASPGVALNGPSLDPIEVVGPTPEGPWEKVSVAIEEGHETIRWSGGAGDTCYLKVFGWPDRVLTLKFPPLPPAPAKPEKTETRPVPPPQAPAPPPSRPPAQDNQQEGLPVPPGEVPKPPAEGNPVAPKP